MKKWMLFLIIFCKAFSSDAPGTLPEHSDNKDIVYDIDQIISAIQDLPIEIQQEIFLKRFDTIAIAIQIDPDFNWEKAQHIMNFVRKAWWTKFSEEQRKNITVSFIDIFLNLIKKLPDKVDKIAEFMFSMNYNIYNPFFVRIDHILSDSTQINQSEENLNYISALKNLNKDLIWTKITNGIKLTKYISKNKSIENFLNENKGKIFINIQTNIEIELNPDEEATYRGATALMYAATMANFGYRTDSINLLLNQGADPNILGGEGIAALLLVFNNKDLVEVLLNHGADPNIYNAEGLTALILAANYGLEDVIELLLNNGANPNIQTQNGYTALIYAALMGHEKIVKLLLDKDANFEIQSEEGHTALIASANDGYTKIAELLLNKGANFDIQNKQGFTTLIDSAQNGHLDLVNLLLDRNAKLDIQNPNKNNFTALIYAAQNGYPDIVKSLVDKGANPNIQTLDGSTALDIARKKYNETNEDVYENIINLLEPVTNKKSN